MAGMNLRSGGGAGANAGSFTATAAAPPSMSGTTATQQAYGTASGTGPSTAKNGTIIAGLAGIGLILFFWHTLPR